MVSNQHIVKITSTRYENYPSTRKLPEHTLPPICWRVVHIKCLKLNRVLIIANFLSCGLKVSLEKFVLKSRSLVPYPCNASPLNIWFRSFNYLVASFLAPAAAKLQKTLWWDEITRANQIHIFFTHIHFCVSLNSPHLIRTIARKTWSIWRHNLGQQMNAEWTVLIYICNSYVDN